MALIGLNLLLLAWLMGRLTHDALHPAVGFPAVWGLVLLLIAAAQAWGYHAVAAPALLLYLAGAACFALGAWQGAAVVPAQAPPAPLAPTFWRRLAWLCLALHALGLPLAWAEMQAIGAMGGSNDLLALAFQLRVQAVSGEATLGPVAGNYLVLGLILIPLLALGALQRALSWTCVALLALPWVAGNLLANGRAPLVLLVLVLLYLRLLQPERLRLRGLLVLVGIGLTLFAAGAVLVGKEGIDLAGDPAEIAALVGKNLADYLLQGPILFSAWWEQPQLLVPSWDPLRVPCLALQPLGWCEAGPLHQEYLPFGEGERLGNVYSIYFSWLPGYGWAGALAGLWAYGLWAGQHHQRARQGGSLLQQLMGANLAAAVVLSVFLDNFLPQLNFLAKLALVAWALPRLLGGRQEQPCPA
ncbi:hypothetical protein [Inhella proteolytica]|uniref:Oligosaccharide repeat unit polymerase n=1 Tax=Inhella proteolytica TaxID=2795029 RepID=A0A931J7X8_9BURK|nr:hypothetical protein [Inhella proteolytica]MBH9578002.1 hypothetical protein [Inhella proteolytica]